MHGGLFWPFTILILQLIEISAYPILPFQSQIQIKFVRRPLTAMQLRRKALRRQFIVDCCGKPCEYYYTKTPPPPFDYGLNEGGYVQGDYAILDDDNVYNVGLDDHDQPPNTTTVDIDTTSPITSSSENSTAPAATTDDSTDGTDDSTSLTDTTVLADITVPADSSSATSLNETTIADVVVNSSTAPADDVSNVTTVQDTNVTVDSNVMSQSDQAEGVTEAETEAGSDKKEKLLQPTPKLKNAQRLYRYTHTSTRTVPINRNKNLEGRIMGWWNNIQTTRAVWATTLLYNPFDYRRGTNPKKPVIVWYRNTMKTPIPKLVTKGELGVILLRNKNNTPKKKIKSRNKKRFTVNRRPFQTTVTRALPFQSINKNGRPSLKLIPLQSRYPERYLFTTRRHLISNSLIPNKLLFQNITLIKPTTQTTAIPGKISSNRSTKSVTEITVILKLPSNIINRYNATKTTLQMYPRKLVVTPKTTQFFTSTTAKKVPFTSQKQLFAIVLQTKKQTNKSEKPPTSKKIPNKHNAATNLYIGHRNLTSIETTKRTFISTAPNTITNKKQLVVTVLPTKTKSLESKTSELPNNLVIRNNATKEILKIGVRTQASPKTSQKINASTATGTVPLITKKQSDLLVSTTQTTPKKSVTQLPKIFVIKNSTIKPVLKISPRKITSRKKTKHIYTSTPITTYASKKPLFLPNLQTKSTTQDSKVLVSVTQQSVATKFVNSTKKREISTKKASKNKYDLKIFSSPASKTKIINKLADIKSSTYSIIVKVIKKEITMAATSKPKSTNIKVGITVFSIKNDPSTALKNTKNHSTKFLVADGNFLTTRINSNTNREIVITISTTILPFTAFKTDFINLLTTNIASTTTQTPVHSSPTKNLPSTTMKASNTTVASMISTTTQAIINKLLTTNIPSTTSQTVSKEWATTIILSQTTQTILPTTNDPSTKMQADVSKFSTTFILSTTTPATVKNILTTAITYTTTQATIINVSTTIILSSTTQFLQKLSTTNLPNTTMKTAVNTFLSTNSKTNEFEEPTGETVADSLSDEGQTSETASNEGSSLTEIQADETESSKTNNIEEAAGDIIAESLSDKKQSLESELLDESNLGMSETEETNSFETRNAVQSTEKMIIENLTNEKKVSEPTTIHGSQIDKTDNIGNNNLEKATENNEKPIAESVSDSETATRSDENSVDEGQTDSSETNDSVQQVTEEIIGEILTDNEQTSEPTPITESQFNKTDASGANNLEEAAENIIAENVSDLETATRSDENSVGEVQTDSSETNDSVQQVTEEIIGESLTDNEQTSEPTPITESQFNKTDGSSANNLEDAAENIIAESVSDEEQTSETATSDENSVGEAQTDNSGANESAQVPDAEGLTDIEQMSELVTIEGQSLDETQTDEPDTNNLEEAAGKIIAESAN